MPDEPELKREPYTLTEQERSLFEKIRADSNAVVIASNNQAGGALRMLLAAHGLGDMNDWIFAEDFSTLTRKPEKPKPEAKT